MRDETSAEGNKCIGFVTHQATLDLSMLKQSREHLRRNGMTYASHMRFAASHGASCIWSGILLVIHAVVPAWFQAAGSTLVRRLSQSFGHDGRELQDHDAGSIW